MQRGRISHEREVYFSPPRPPKHFALIFASGKLQRAKDISDYTDLDVVFLPLACWYPLSALSFVSFPSTQYPHPICEKEDAFWQVRAEKITSKHGSCGESTGEQSPTESRQGRRMEKCWVRSSTWRPSVGKGTDSSSRGTVDMPYLELSLVSLSSP